MDFIGKNEQVLDFFSADLTLLSGQLLKIIICQENMNLTVELDVQLLYAKRNKAYKIKFIDVQEYSFYHHKDYIFYNISNYKFMRNNGLFYISLDPDEDESSVSTNDQDFISSVALEAYSI